MEKRGGNVKAFVFSSNAPIPNFFSGHSSSTTAFPPTLTAVQSTTSITQNRLAGVPTLRKVDVSKKGLPKSSTTRRE